MAVKREEQYTNDRPKIITMQLPRNRSWIYLGLKPVTVAVDADLFVARNMSLCQAAVAEAVTKFEKLDVLFCCASEGNACE